MRQYKITLLFILCFLIARLHSTEIQKMPINQSVFSYSANVKNDTISIITYNNKMNFYKIYNNQIIGEKQLGESTTIEQEDQIISDSVINITTNNWGHKHQIIIDSTIKILFKDRNFFELNQINKDNRVSSIQLNLSNQFNLEKYLSVGSKEIVIASKDERKFTIDFDNLNRLYKKYYYIDLSDKSSTEFIPLQTGRTRNREFETTVYDSTIYAIWREDKNTTLLNLIHTGWERNLLFTKYINDNWSKPTTLLSDIDQMIVVLGVFKINSKIYCFWAEDNPDNHHSTILYKTSTDLINWSNSISLPGSFEYLGKDDFSECKNTENKPLHMILKKADDNGVGYYIFDGEKLELQFDIENISQRYYYKYSIVFDNEKPHLFYMKGSDDAEIFHIDLSK